MVGEYVWFALLAVPQGVRSGQLTYFDQGFFQGFVAELPHVFSMSSTLDSSAVAGGCNCGSFMGPVYRASGIRRRGRTHPLSLRPRRRNVHTGSIRSRCRGVALSALNAVRSLLQPAGPRR